MSAAARTAGIGLLAALVVAGAAAGADGQGGGAAGGAGAGSAGAAAQPGGGAVPSVGGAVPSGAPASAASAPTWVAVPSGWRPMAELAPARAAPAGSALKIDAASAFGDPALGCFALVQSVSAPAEDFEVQRAMDRITRDLGAAGLTIGAGAAGSDIPFSGRGFEGRMRVTTAAEGGRVALRSVACFYNGREPERCRTACQTMLDSAGARR